MNKLNIILPAIALVTLVSACKEKPGTATSTATGTAATSTAATGTAAGSPDGDKVIITVNNETITLDEFRSAIAGLPTKMRPAMTTARGKKALAEELVRVKLLEQEGRRLGVDKEAEIARRIELSNANLIAAATLEKLASGGVSDDELRASYAKNQKNLEVTKARQIVLAYKGGQLPERRGAAKSEAEVMAEAKKLVERVRGGENFAKVAAAVSDEPNAAKSGGAFLYQRGTAPEDVSRLIESLPPNGISDPIKTPLAIHIIQVVARETRPFEEVKTALVQETQGERAEKVIADLKAKAKVEMDNQYFAEPPAETTATAAKKN